MTENLTLSPFLLLILAPLIVRLLRDVRGRSRATRRDRLASHAVRAQHAAA